MTLSTSLRALVAGTALLTLTTVAQAQMADKNIVENAVASSVTYHACRSRHSGWTWGSSFWPGPLHCIRANK